MIIQRGSSRRHFAELRHAHSSYDFPSRVYNVLRYGQPGAPSTDVCSTRVLGVCVGARCGQGAGGGGGGCRYVGVCTAYAMSRRATLPPAASMRRCQQDVIASCHR